MKPRRQRRGAQFGAPWGRTVKFATAVACALTVGLTVMIPFTMRGGARWAAYAGPAILVLVLGITALFCVRGFTIDRSELSIRRLFWDTRFPLGDLRDAQADPSALKGAVRAAGNGGFLAITGWFYSKRLGKFRAFVTDPARCVVLEFKNRKVVVSPDDPEGFIAALGFDPAARREER
jgi:hypothetical protein